MLRPQYFVVLAVALVAAVVVVLVFCFPRKVNNGTESYYSTGDYNAYISVYTLKEYSDQNGLDLLYFDWYGQTEYLYDTIYTDKQTDNIICFEEIIVNNDTEDMIELYVKESATEIDFLSVYDVICTDEYTSASGVNVYYGKEGSSAYATFEYNGYQYYIVILYIENTADILTYAEILLP